MKVEEEFSVKNSAGKVLPIEYLSPKLTYLDFGASHLPRGFEGYRVKDTTTIVEKLNDGSFKVPGTGSNDIYQRI